MKKVFAAILMLGIMMIPAISYAVETDGYNVSAEESKTIKSVRLDVTDYYYAGGAEIEPVITVIGSDDETLSRNYYTIDCANNIYPGTAKATVTGRNGYSGTRAVSYTIKRANISTGSVKLEDSKDYVYNGSSQKPNPEDVTVKYEGNTLTYNTDYTISYSNNVNAGSATIKATGKGYYTGTAIGSFTIKQADLSGGTVTPKTSSYTYDGTAKEPSVTVKVGNKTLSNNRDYTITRYEANVNAGTATVKVESIADGNYWGSNSGTFTINTAKLKTVIIEPKVFEYDPAVPKEYKPTVTVKDTYGKVMPEGNYSVEVINGDITKPGEVILEIKAKKKDGVQNCTGGPLTATYQIKGVLDTITFNPETYTYTGKALKPSAIVKDKAGQTLKENTDYTLSYSNNTNAGWATVTATGKGLYTDTITGYFYIEPITLTANNSSVTANTASYTYDGTEKKPLVTVKWDKKTLSKDKDYEIFEYTNNVNAGTATVTVKGKGNFGGTVSGTFTIKTTKLKTVTLDPKVFEYDPTKNLAYVPMITVKDTYGKVIPEGNYFIGITNGDITKPGTVTLTINAQDLDGKYKNCIGGPLTATYQIKSVLDTVTFDPATYTYDGTAQKPKPIVKDKAGQTLKENTDYTLQYTNNKSVGTATVTATGKGIYTGTATGTFWIEPADLSKGTIKLSTTSYTYDGIAKEPSFTVKDEKGNTLKKDTDFTFVYDKNKNAGTATLKVTGKGNYKNDKIASFEIKQATLKTVALEKKTYDYDGTEKTPAVTVKDSLGKVMLADDYTVSYANNKNPGTATVTVKAKTEDPKNCTGGPLTATFQIKGVLGTVTLAQTSYKYDGKAKTPAVTVKDKGNNVLTKGTDYTVSYKNNTKVGVATVTVTGKGNYSGKLTATFTIIGISLKTATVDPTTYVYDGTEKKPTVKVKDENGKSLKVNTDYTVQYSNNKNVGKAKVIVSAKGNYSGTLTAEFTITAAPLARMTLTPSSYDYDGKEKTPAVTVQDTNGKTLTADKDYTVSYKNNIGPGMATATATGKGNYTGTISKDYGIGMKSNPMTITAKNKTVKAKALKKKAKSFSLINVKNAKGEISYSAISGPAALKINPKNGKITIKKKAKKGVYKMKVHVYAAGEGEYSPADKTVNVKITVK